MNSEINGQRYYRSTIRATSFRSVPVYRAEKKGAKAAPPPPLGPR